MTSDIFGRFTKAEPFTPDEFNTWAVSLDCTEDICLRLARTVRKIELELIGIKAARIEEKKTLIDRWEAAVSLAEKFHKELDELRAENNRLKKQVVEHHNRLKKQVVEHQKKQSLLLTGDDHMRPSAFYNGQDGLTALYPDGTSKNIGDVPDSMKWDRKPSPGSECVLPPDHMPGTQRKESDNVLEFKGRVHEVYKWAQWLNEKSLLWHKVASLVVFHVANAIEEKFKKNFKHFDCEVRAQYDSNFDGVIVWMKVTEPNTFLTIHEVGFAHLKNDLANLDIHIGPFAQESASAYQKSISGEFLEPGDPKLRKAFKEAEDWLVG